MPTIVRAEFLSYYNSARNSDKVFNVFVIEDDDGSFRCVTEYGRRGNSLVRDTLCTRTSREIAESKLRQKLAAKRNHRETPYSDDTFGYNYSQLAKEYSFNDGRSSSVSSSRPTQAPQTIKPLQPKQNVVEFPARTVEQPREKPEKGSILNQEQMNSLEI